MTDDQQKSAAEARAQGAQEDRTAQPREASGSDQRGIVTREGRDG